jgi:hypothetical protein
MELSDEVKKYFPKDLTPPSTLGNVENGFQALKPYKNSYCTAFILGIMCKPDCEACVEYNATGNLDPLSGIDSARFGQGRFKPNAKQKKILSVHGIEYKNGQRPALVDNGIQIWNAMSLNLMMALLRCKFTKDNKLGSSLLDYKDQLNDILFTEHTTNDKIWADNLDGTGTNFLGKLLTIRLGELVNNKIEQLDMEYLMQPNNKYVNYSN